MVCIRSRSRNLDHHLAFHLDLNSRYLAVEHLPTVTRMACQSSVSSVTVTYALLVWHSNASLPRSNLLRILSIAKAFLSGISARSKSMLVSTLAILKADAEINRRDEVSRIRQLI